MPVIFKTSNLKAKLQQKTSTWRKQLEGATAVAAIAHSADLDLLPELKLERIPVKALKGLARRVRKTDLEQLRRVMRSLQQHGQCAPIVIDAKGRIVHGHIVAAAMRELGQTEIWCVRLGHLSEHECELLHIALNRLGETGDWEIEALGDLLIDLDKHQLDISVSGFSLPELDILLQPTLDDDEAGGDEEDDVAPPAQPVSLLGDLWQLGKHLLLCADSTKAESYQILLDGQQVDCVVADSPWNLPIAGFVSGLGEKKHQDFKMGAGEMTPEEFRQFSNTWTKHCADHLVKGGAFFSFIDWRMVEVILEAGRQAGLKRYNLLVWDKGIGGMGACWRSRHELIPTFTKGATLAVNNVELGKHGRNRTNVLAYPGANQKGSSANEGLAFHPTSKPVPLIEDLLLDVTKRGATVLDPFSGSGSTILSAERSSRVARCIELDPAYVDVGIIRWQQAAQSQAIHVATGLTFDQIAAQRLAQAA